MIDETGLENIDGLKEKLPEYKSDYSLDDILKILSQFGITMTEEKRKMNFIVIRDIDR